MENSNPVQPLDPNGATPQPSVLDRVLNRQPETADAPGGNITLREDNVLRTNLTECINPSCTAVGSELPADGTEAGICPTCGFNTKERF